MGSSTKRNDGKCGGTSRKVRRDSWCWGVCCGHLLAPPSRGGHTRQEISDGRGPMSSPWEKWLLTLTYTRPKARPVTVTSQPFASPAVTKAALHSWQLSWERGPRKEHMKAMFLQAPTESSRTWVGGIRKHESHTSTRCVVLSVLHVTTPWPPRLLSE